MSDQPDGGSAFPRFQSEHIYLDNWDRNGERRFVAKDGMSLRDYFAGQVLASYTDKNIGIYIDVHNDRAEGSSRRRDNGHELENLATAAYQIADAMLAERAK